MTKGYLCVRCGSQVVGHSQKECDIGRVVLDFETWWASTGSCLDLDTVDVPWFDKRRELAGLAYVAGCEQKEKEGGRTSWQLKLKDALSEMLAEVEVTISEDHLVETPERIVKMWEECLIGEPDLDEARKVLKKGFKHDSISQMIHTTGVQFTTWCAHHLVPILCIGHFAYIPNGKIVGLSKVIRLIEIVAHRPQVQEVLTDAVTHIFWEEVKPLGCGLVVDAQHMCMIARGVRKRSIWTRTTSLRGEFLEEPSVRQEFLATVPPVKG